MKSNRMYQKFIFLFVLYILLPFLLILIFLAWRSNRLQLENDRSQNEALAVQTINAVNQQVLYAENVVKSVLQNEMLVAFLDKEFQTSLDLSYYTTSIRDFVKITNGVSDIKLRLYLDNDTLPMGFGIFYPIRYIEHVPVMKSFYESDETSNWVNGNYEFIGDTIFLTGSIDSVMYLHKIQSGTRTIGLMVSMIPTTSFYISSSTTGEELRPVILNDTYIYNYSDKILHEQLIHSLDNKQAGLLITKSLLCTRHTFPQTPFDIIVVTGRSHSIGILVLAAGFAIMFLIATATLFILYNRKTIRDINSCLDSIEIAIANGFQSEVKDMKITHLHYTRDDEISELALRISDLLVRIRTLLWQTVEQQIAAKQAQFLALQQQINPHFMYNTMEVFSSRMEFAGLYEESSAISAFCKMLRYNVNTKELMTTLEQEIEQVKYFIAIQKLRRIPFELIIDIPQKLMHCCTIRFLLQPFVENCFKYIGNANPLIIRISASLRDEKLLITIENNGEEIPADRLEELNSRFATASATVKSSGDKIGLNNINSRLKLYYGDNHFIHISSKNNLTTFSFLIDHIHFS